MSTAYTPAPLPYYAHPDARLESDRIGPGTRIWAFAHVLAGAHVGADCNLCDHTFIEGGATIGDRVTVKCGVQVWDGVTLEDDVFVGPNATFTNDPFPRSRRKPARYMPTVVRKGASIGANATLLPGITVGSFAMVGAGAVVTRDVPPRAIVAGNPAKVTGYVDGSAPGADRPLRPRGRISREIRGGQKVGETPLVGEARLYELPRISDPRGHLSFAEIRQSLPFAAARYFLVFGVPSREIRGEHAHRTLEQFLVCVHGSCSVRLFDGARSEEVLLDRPDLGVYVPRMMWTTEYKYSADAVLLVLASDVYRDEDYIRNLDEYLAAVPIGAAKSGQRGACDHMKCNPVESNPAESKHDSISRS